MKMKNTDTLATPASSGDMAQALGHILEESLNEIYIFNADSLQFILANKGARKNSGYSLDELQEMTPLDLKTDYTLKSFTKLLQPLRDTEQKVIHFEARHQRKDGSYYPVEVHLQPANYNDASAFVAIILDISARKNAEKELAFSERRAQAVLDNAVEGVVNISEKGLMLTFNKAAETIFGYNAAEVIGKNVNLLMPAPYKKEHDGYINNYISTKEKKIIGIGREVVGLRKNGEEFPMDLSVAETVIDSQRTFTGIIRDITENKAIEEKLQKQSEEARKTHEQLAHISRLSTMGEMAAGIAHEINQPLTAIATYAQAAKRLLNINNTQDLNETLEKIDKQAQRAGEVIKRLRAMVGKQESKRVLSDINTLVLDTLALLSSDIINSKITINLDLAKDLPNTEVDVIQIQQVIINLIRNSMDAMQDTKQNDKRMMINSSLTDNDSLKVTVTDCGPGLQQQDASEIFNPFHTSKKTGMGMGLSISRSIVTAHGGQLGYDSSYTDGARFYIILPIIPNQSNTL